MSFGSWLKGATNLKGLNHFLGQAAPVLKTVGAVAALVPGIGTLVGGAVAGLGGLAGIAGASSAVSSVTAFGGDILGSVGGFLGKLPDQLLGGVNAITGELNTANTTQSEYNAAVEASMAAFKEASDNNAIVAAGGSIPAVSNKALWLGAAGLGLFFFTKKR